MLVAVCLLWTVPPVHAQKSSRSGSPSVSADATRASLAVKARDLEARGRPDLALQIWQQILLSAPDNADALAGVARDYKLTGDQAKADAALMRLRRVHPNDPNIARIEAMSANGPGDELRQAGDLAKQGRNDDAMRIYRRVYGDHPPDGDIALAYFQTLYGTAGGKQEAIAGMRGLAERNPGDPRYAVQLGVMLTRDQHTRAEGIRILRTHAGDPDAQAAYRQALIWDSANPASAAELREYLKTHPNDTEISGALRKSETTLAQMNTGIARTPAERAAFAALNAHRIDEAEQRFTALLAADPNNGRLAAGMGFLRMQQKNFSGAIGYLVQAEKNGHKVTTVETALATSRFWLTLGEGTQALDENQLDLAATKFRAALEMNPRSADALDGLAGVYTRQQQYSAAATVYQQLLQIQPALLEAWRGLFLAYAHDNQNAKALAIAARFPAKVKASLDKDPEYLHALAGIYQAQNRPAEAQRILALALSLPFPDNSATLLAGTKLQYAGILMDAKHYDQALAVFSQVLASDPSNVSAWEGRISAQHEMGQDTDAIADVQKMPAATYETALADPSFLATLASIYQQANQFEVAQGLLERSLKLAIAAGGQPSVALQLQLAAIYLVRNNNDQAYALYRQVLTDHPDRADAWKGLIAALTATHRDQEALQEIAQIPAPARKQLDGDIDFLETEASLYATTGDTTHAVQYMNRVQAYYAKAKEEPPPSVDIQNVWLLYNMDNDRALYAALMRIGGRTDLSLAQRETVQTIWANWSVRRAAAALDNGNAQRAVDILEAAAQAFPNNLTVRKAVAGGFARVGRAREALALFKTVPMQDASAGDFEGAVGAALAANDRGQAEVWLRQALERFATDPAILALAGRYEQARGDNERAADYYRASLAAMPKVSPVDRLAHVLVYPETDTRVHRAVTAADLKHLLDPDYEPFAKTTKLPPLPTYGPDPYNPAPVVLPPTPPAETNPVPPAATTGPGAFVTPVSGPAVLAASTPPEAMHASQVRPYNAENYSYRHPFVREPHLVHASWSPTTIRARPSFPLTRASMHVIQIHPAIQSAIEAFGQVAIIPNPPHSLAADSWKGLVFSLMAGNRNAEALSELGKIPPDVRRQLEADVEWVQGVASLYFAVGDTQHATLYLHRVENYLLVHHTALPANLEVQHAWLLYNLRDDVALYPILQRLDARQGLTADQRQQVETLWAEWAVRRADDAMKAGNLARGVEILQAASQDYPGNMTVRLAVAGAYARVGRSQEAVTLFKSLNMNEASVGDFQGAVSAAISAADMAQAEAWLRIALGKYPNDPIVLGLAARFEQARGNNERASAFWRAAIAAMPPGTGVKSLDYGLVMPPGTTYRTPGPGDAKRLLNPQLDPRPDSASTLEQLAPLPSYKPQTTTQAPVFVPGRPATAPAPQATAPSAEPLPLPRSSGDMPMGQGTAPSNQPPYVPHAANRNPSSSGPAFVEQRNSQPPLTGRVQLPPTEETINTTDSEGSPSLPPQTSKNAAPQTPPANPRITSEPMGPAAAQTQALIAEQTDSQLTQGSATVIHNVPNAPVAPMPPVQSTPMAQTPPAKNDGQGAYNTAQYTPSAQEAATGAYSAPQQPTPQQQPQATPPQPPAKPQASATGHHKRKKSQQAQTTGTSNPPPEAAAPAIETAPPPEAQQPQQPAPAPQEPSSESTTSTGLSDEELEQRSLPPLRGPWIRIQRQDNQPTPRDLAEQQLQAIESGYSGWLGGSTVLNYRTGALGYSQLAAIEAPFEASAHLGYSARITAIARPVFLDSGQADGTAVISVLESTVSGSALTAIPEPIGTLTATNVIPPAQQNAVGIGGELQLAFPHFAIAGGYTPYNFLVANFTGRLVWKPGNGPFTFSLTRDSIKDSQLSYAGLRDPGLANLSNPGPIWGGVVYDQGQVQFAHGDAQSGYYFNAGGQYITGYHVLNNNRIDGNGGAYWRVFTSPEYGTLSVGANFFAMRYANNQNAFTHGMGGYFSPQGYFLGNVPFTWSGHYINRWHYNIMGAVGAQGFQENSAPLWPLAGDKPLEIAQNNPRLPDVTTVSGNYDVRSQVAYQFSPHWFVGGYLAANNSRDYTSTSVGFFVRFLFREQPSAATNPTGLFPWDGMRPFTVP
ncbi:MAG: cellulose synthase subunit BcsC-related outer membrane protein [Terracidiphilus sp.]|nr:cellulose synthase subunit BcsC-related outer membrane protein [Terracidiphilus sp.]